MKPVLFSCHCSPYDISQPACSWIDPPAPNKTASPPAAQQMFCSMSVRSLLGAFWVPGLTLLSIIHSFDQWWSAVLGKKCAVRWGVELKEANNGIEAPRARPKLTQLYSLLFFSSSRKLQIAVGLGSSESLKVTFISHTSRHARITCHVHQWSVGPVEKSLPKGGSVRKTWKRHL